MFEASYGNFEILVGLQRLVFKAGQVVIVKNFPPLTFAESIFGSAFAPGFSDVPVGGLGRGGALIFWADGAARNTKCRENCKKRK